MSPINPMTELGITTKDSPRSVDDTVTFIGSGDFGF
jgi:hypothetical protein